MSIRVSAYRGDRSARDRHRHRLRYVKILTRERDRRPGGGIAGGAVFLDTSHLSPGCRAVELSRLHRARAVEGLSRQEAACLSSLSE